MLSLKSCSLRYFFERPRGAETGYCSRKTHFFKPAIVHDAAHAFRAGNAQGPTIYKPYSQSVSQLFNMMMLLSGIAQGPTIYKPYSQSVVQYDDAALRNRTRALKHDTVVEKRTFSSPQVLKHYTVVEKNTFSCSLCYFSEGPRGAETRYCCRKPHLFHKFVLLF